jgi:hypothetical protein
MSNSEELQNFGPYLSRKRVAERYEKSTRTIERWENNPSLGFPQPLDVNGRKLHSEPQLIRWERGRAAPKAT